MPKKHPYTPPTEGTTNNFNIALCQFAVGTDKQANIDKMFGFVSEAARANPAFICLPEMWNCPYTHSYFTKFGEDEAGESVKAMKNAARRGNVFLIGGSIPEVSGGKLYNTCFVINPSGEIIAKHRKMHLFDIDIKGGHSFKESDTFTAGDSLTVFDSPFGKIGVAICFDIRFPEMFAEMQRKGAKLIFLPAVFNMTTGPVHWELLVKSRALDNQIYFAACEQARDINSPFAAYGHSMVANPYGELCGALDQNEGVLHATVDHKFLETIRNQIPLGASGLRICG
jgi:predicted amidohydrolase